MEEKMTNIDRDTASRRRIVSETNSNFFVEAGAGSGKTTMLVNRMVAMVEAGIDISKISAITFTKAAAGEFYDRFQKRLIQRSRPDYQWEDKGMAGQLPCPTEVSRERCKKAQQNIDLCFMGTIDAFCNMVLSEHPSEAGIPSDAKIVTDLEAAAVYRQMYVKICEGEYGAALSSLARDFRIWYRNAEEVFVQGAAMLMGNRNAHFNYSCSQWTASDVDKVFAEKRKSLLRAVKCLMEHPELQYSGNKDSINAWEKIDVAYDNIKYRWSNNLTNVLYGLRTLKNICVIPEAEGKYEFELGEALMRKSKSSKVLVLTATTTGKLMDKLQKMQYDITMTFLDECVPILEQAMRDRGYMTFFDCLYYLRNMLKKDAEENGSLIEYISNRHRYYLIDEFQDTNPMQAEVFFYLSAEHPVPRWSECVPRKGSLFIVGDPKQSIYRFRSADVAAFMRVKKLFEANEGEVLSLSRNFRSTRVLCEYFNHVFTKSLPEETKDQSKFEEIPLPEAEADTFQGIFTYKAYSGKAEEEHPDETDPIKIAAIIERLVGRDDYKILPADGGQPRPIRYSDFMIITYGKSKLAPIAAKLKEKGISVRVEGDVPFGENKALREVFGIYAAIAEPRDKRALYGALTGSLFALTEEDILTFKSCGGSLSLRQTPEPENVVEEAALRVYHRLEQLNKLRAEAMRLSPAALFSKIIDDFRIYNFVKAETLEVLYYTLELLRNAEKSGQVVSLKDATNYIRELMAGGSGEERCLGLNDTQDRVHMANLHKVKGLEAPIVILAAAKNSGSFATIRIEHGDQGSQGYVFSLMSDQANDKNSFKYFETKEHSDKQREEKESLNAENERLIYVAATRARNALILCNRVEIRKGKDTVISKWKPLLQQGIPDIFDIVEPCEQEREAVCETRNAAELYEAAERTCVLNHRDMEEATYSIENPSRLQVSSKLAEQQVDEVSETQRFPALLGTMTHKLMEILVSTKGRTEIKNAVREITQEYLTPATEQHETLLSEALRHVAETVKNGGYEQENSLPQDILGTLLNADEVYCEVPFCYKEVDDGRSVIWKGVMDVVYCAEGKWHIVDYKTNADGKDLDMKYQAQLDAYKRAFHETTGYEADALTYHIDV